EPHRPAAAGVCLGVRFAALDKAVRASSPSVRGAPLGPISGDEPRRRALCGGLRPRRGGYRRRFVGENRCDQSAGWVTSPAGVAAEPPGAFIWEKSGSDVRHPGETHLRYVEFLSDLSEKSQLTLKDQHERAIRDSKIVVFVRDNERRRLLSF